MLKLRDYQESDINNIRRMVSNGTRRVLYKLATGGGKTVMVSSIAQSTALKRKTFYFIVHRRELIKQSSETFTKCGIPHGVIAPGRSETDDYVQIASIDALAARIKKGGIYRPDVIAWDEAHHAASPKWANQAEAMSTDKTIHIGLTATPERLDGKGLDNMFDKMILGAETKELIDRGFLCEFEHFAPPSQIDLEGLRSSKGDFFQGQLRDLIDDPALIGNAVDHYLEIASGKRAIAFCVGIEHSKNVAAQFREAGIPATHIDGKDTAHRERALKAFNADEIKVITNCDIVSEGFDVPAMEVVIMLRPTQSLSLYLQQAGRALRKDASNPDKVALILDHAGNIHRHGMIDEIRAWTIEGRKKRNKDEGTYVPPVRQCPVCFMVHPPAPRCPSCNNIYVVDSSMPDEIEGTLTRFEATQQELSLKKKNAIKVAKCTTYEELVEVGKELGNKSGWAGNYWPHHKNNPDKVKR